MLHGTFLEGLTRLAVIGFNRASHPGPPQKSNRDDRGEYVIAGEVGQGGNRGAQISFSKTGGLRLHRTT